MSLTTKFDPVGSEDRKHTCYPRPMNGMEAYPLSSSNRDKAISSHADSFSSINANPLFSSSLTPPPEEPHSLPSYMVVEPVISSDMSFAKEEKWTDFKIIEKGDNIKLTLVDQIAYPTASCPPLVDSSAKAISEKGYFAIEPNHAMNGQAIAQPQPKKKTFFQRVFNFHHHATSFGKGPPEQFLEAQQQVPVLHTVKNETKRIEQGSTDVEEMKQAIHNSISSIFHFKITDLKRVEQLVVPSALDESLISKLKSSMTINALEMTFDEKYHFCSSKIIGKGGSGTIRLARGANDHVVYAVKEFRKRRKEESKRDYLKKLTAEFCISSMLHHTNVIETYDIIRDGTHWFEIMEYCPGGDLFNVIRDGYLKGDDVDMCFKQLLLGVQYLHAMGVAHRDLKPENLLIDAKGHLKITDFGVSEVFRVAWEKDVHSSRGVCGSAPYMAPEVLAGKEYVPSVVDIWACGIIYYAMTFHGIPWAVASPSDPNYRHYLVHKGVGFEPLVRLPKHAQLLLRRILEPDPKLRITVEEVMKNTWISSIHISDHRFSDLLSKKVKKNNNNNNNL